MSSKLRILEVAQIRPSSYDDSTESATESSLPLTMLDTSFLNSPQIEYLSFYLLTSTSTTHFHSAVLPFLKRSLSLALAHYLPLTGHLRWSPDGTTSSPSIFYSSNGHVWLTVVAEDSVIDSNLFSQLTGNFGKAREVSESRLYVPELQSSDSEAALLTIQITLFPNQGISIGISFHHAILDAKALTLFIKSWAHMNQRLLTGQDHPSSSLILPPELTPVTERNAVEDPEGIISKHLKFWAKMNDVMWGNPRSLRLIPATLPNEHPSSNLVMASFELSMRDIDRIRKNVSDSDQGKIASNNKNLSSFVLAYAYTLVCLVNAKGLTHSGKDVHVGMAADCRARLDPPFPDNYLGNCVISHTVLGREDMNRLGEDDGLAFVATRLGSLVERIKSDGPGWVAEAAVDWASKIEDLGRVVSMEVIGVAWSHRLGSYGVDFGWGRPTKVEIPSIDKAGGVYFVESRDGSGGIEVGLALKHHQMEAFRRLFLDGLRVEVA